MTEEKPVSSGVSMSSEEFEQYQRQFLEERTEKYTLLDKVKKLEQEIVRLSGHEKDLDKMLKDKISRPLQNFLSRGKKDSESDNTHHNENESLQKRLLSQEEDFQRQNALLMQELQQVVVRNVELERLMSHSHHEVDGEETFNRDPRRHGEHVLRNDQSFYQTPSSSFDKHGRKESFEEAVHETFQVELDLIASREEIRLLHVKLEESTKEKEKVVVGLEATMTTIVQDLEHKQSTIHTLLTEREDAQRVYTERINALASEKENSVRTELEKLRAENNEMHHTVEDERVMSRTRIEDVERQMKDLLEQMDVTSRQTKRDSDELLTEHKVQIATLLQQVETLIAEKTVLEESESQRIQLLTSLEEENTRLQASQHDLTRLAEKRKATIDDMTTHLESLKAKHEAELRNKVSELNAMIDCMNGELKILQDKVGKVPGLTADATRLKAVTADLIHEKEHLDAQLGEVNSSLTNLQQSSGKELIEAKASIDHLSGELESARKLNEIVTGSFEEEKQNLISSHEKQIAELQQKIHDHAEEVKIAERKHTGVSRDVQKQLQSEKKRVEKLQNKLNELLRDGTGKLRIGQGDDFTDFTEKEETSSVSSWSFVSSKSQSKRAGPQGDAASVSSKTETETGGIAASMTEEEVRDLFIRITKLQQEKASLAERVVMLESGNASMANDLRNKSALVETFLRSTPVLGYQGQSAKDTDIFSLRSVMERLGRDKSIDVDTQKSLRHLLEETLTKNIHLQKNMELLTEELDRLRGSTPPRQ